MSSFHTQSLSPRSTSHSFIPDPQRKLIKNKLVGIFEKIQNPTTEKPALTSYIEFLNEFDLYTPSNKTPFYILKHISLFVTSLPLDSKKQALKLFSSFFSVFPSLASPSLVSYLDFILKCLQSHLNNKTPRILANCFEDIVKNLNSLSQGKPVSIINNMLYNYSIQNPNFKYGMMCLKKLIENSSIISSDGYYENIINNIFFDLYNSAELGDDDETKCEMLNCVIRIILLKENNFKKFAKQTLDTIYLDMIHVNSILQKKVLNVIYLLVLYCAATILPFTNEVSSMIRSLKRNSDKHVRENAVLILQLYHDILDNYESGNGDISKLNDKKKGLKRSNSQEQIVLNKKNDDLHISRSYGAGNKVKPMKKTGEITSSSNSKMNGLGRCRSHANFFYNNDKGLNANGNNGNNNKLKVRKLNPNKKVKQINTNSRTAPSGFYQGTFKRGASTAKSMSSSGFKLSGKGQFNRRNLSVNKQRKIQRTQQDDMDGKLSISDLKVQNKEFTSLKGENKENTIHKEKLNNCKNNDNKTNEKDVQEFQQLMNMSKQMEEITDRMDALIKTMSKLQNDTSSQISNLNSRVKTMETAINSISSPPEQKRINNSNESQRIQSPIQRYNHSNEEQLLQSPSQTYHKLNEEHSIYSPNQRFNQSHEQLQQQSPISRYTQSHDQFQSPNQRYYQFHEEQSIDPSTQTNFYKSISHSQQPKSSPFNSTSNINVQFNPEQSHHYSSTYNSEPPIYHGSMSQHQLLMMTPESPLEQDILYALQTRNDEILLNIISIISIEDIKTIKAELIDEMIVALLGIAIRGIQIHGIVSFIQLCLIAVKECIKASTISTIKDILNYVVNNKYADLSRSDVMDINTMLTQLP